MNLTDKEKVMMKEWAGRENSRIERYDEARDSFWEICDAKRNIVEYDFRTVPELRRKLEETLKECDDVILPMCVCAFKKREENGVASESNGTETVSKDFSIPEFTYIF